ncbi:MAG: right-handed parallel beta-helix repeat-containing protein [Thermoplasmata archaeon]|nr:MAG: right-handed parallel beta-helix repeat-containing protein [Thermoplasmata archaeon]
MHLRFNSISTVILLITLVFAGMLNPSVECAAAEPVPFSSYTPREPILIESDTGFNTTNGVTGGSGTPTDPYIIEGWEINTSSSDGIEIRNTTAHFVIRDTYVHGYKGNRGIFLHNLSNGAVINSTVYNSTRGIILYITNSMILHNNTVYNHSTSGIEVLNSRYINITNNNVTQNNNGIWCSSSWKLNISLNDIGSNTNYGIYFISTYDSTIMKNNITDNTFSIYLFVSGNNNLDKNHAWLNQYGIYLSTSSDDNYILNNNLSSNLLNGIVIWDCTNSTIINNTMLNLSTCVYVQYSFNTRIIGNDLNLSLGGILCEGSMVGNISENWISNNSNGINFVSTSLYNITDNEVFNNSYGILFNSGNDDNLISSNNIFFNGEGISIIEGDKNTITNNDIYQNEKGIRIIGESTYNIIKYNKITNNTGVGIGLESSAKRPYGNTISENDIGYTWQNGIRITGSDSTYIENNTINHSGYSGISMSDTSEGSITNNSIIYSTNTGLYVGSGDHDIIKDNTISWNGDMGIYIESSYKCILKNNLIESNDEGIYSSNSDSILISNNVIQKNNLNGIYLYHSDLNTAYNNSGFNNTFSGLLLSNSFDNDIIKNQFYSNEKSGIFLSYSDRNDVYENTLTENREGVYSHSSENNKILHNNFIDNTVRQAYETNAVNTWWDYPSGGNYRNDYVGGDQYQGSNQDEIGSDGLGDTYYTFFSTYRDRYPLIRPYAELKPSPPYYLEAYPQKTFIELNWYKPRSSYSAPITHYRIYKGSQPDSKTLIAEVSQYYLYYKDSNVSVGNTYYYQVSAVSAVGESPRSNEVEAINGDVPPTPKITFSSVGDRYIKLAITAPESDGGFAITSYNIYRRTVYSKTYVFVLDLNATEFNDTELVNGVTYYYRISASNKLGEGPRSQEISTHPRSIPASPSQLSAKAEESFIRITWKLPLENGGADVTNYRIYKGVSSGVTSFYAESGGELFYIDEEITKGITYYYRVSALNSEGEGPQSAEVTAVLVSAPSVPINFKAEAGDATVKLSWSEPISDGGTKVTNYIIYRSTKRGERVQHDMINSIFLTYTDIDLMNDVTYYYKISAVNAMDEGPLSIEIGVTPEKHINQAPRASIDANVTSGKAPLSVSFTGGGVDNDGTIVSYFWDFGDGDNSKRQNPNHTYNEPGKYFVELTVTDDDGESHTAMITITVNPVQTDNVTDDGKDDREDKKDEGISVAAAAGVILLIFIIIPFLILVLWPIVLKRKKGKAQEKESEKKDEGKKEERKEEGDREKVKEDDIEPQSDLPPTDVIKIK